jgi:hypothetical protein
MPIQTSSWFTRCTPDTSPSFYNKGGREFESPVLLDVDALPSMATSADLDGDRDSDLVVSSWSSGEILILRNEGNRVFGAPMRYPVGWKYTLGDLDGDDDIDIVSDTDDSSMRCHVKFREMAHLQSRRKSLQGISCTKRF